MVPQGKHIKVGKHMKKILALPLLIFAMRSFSCDRNSAGPQSSVLGQYELSGHDNSGRLIFTGANITDFTGANPLERAMHSCVGENCPRGSP
jgi:hypothetical protein